MSPQRIQQRRTKGWRKPEGAVAVGRGTKWGNPWKIHEPEKWDGVLIQQGKNRQYLFVTPEIAVALYRLWVTHGHTTDIPNRHPFGPDLEELRGKDLMCWCPLDQPCHADVLLELANLTDTTEKEKNR